MILFLQQSSVEWASSLWLRVVQEVDPYFQRTVRAWAERGVDRPGRIAQKNPQQGRSQLY